MEDLLEVLDRIKDKYTVDEFICELGFTFEDLIDYNLYELVRDNYDRCLEVLG